MARIWFSRTRLISTSRERVGGGDCYVIGRRLGWPMTSWFVAATRWCYVTSKRVQAVLSILTAVVCIVTLRQSVVQQS
ncbi:hypothetical protein VB661_004125 [Salmonella enterica]|nr:hypothetical protein [Salmonella enterica]